MASSQISNPVSNPNRSRNKRKKEEETQLKQRQREQLQQQQNSNTRWKSQTKQQLYSFKLLKALSQVNLRSSNPPTTTASDVNIVNSNRNDSAPRGGRDVRKVADRVLAVSAKGRTRWSKAILSNRLHLNFRKHKKQKVAPPTTGPNRSKKPRNSVLRLKGKCKPAVQRKVRLLGRLVPGCQNEPLPVILEEATDYIPALEMQIRAMRALAELLSGSRSGVGSISD